MLGFELVVRDARGVVIDPAGLGVDQVVAAVRQRPDLRGPVGAVGALNDEDAWFAPAMASLEAVEALSRQVAALRAACVAAVADETLPGAPSDAVLDELSCALVVSRRSAEYTRTQSEALRHQPHVWAALCRGALDPPRARILADALFEVPRADTDGIPLATYEADCAQLFEEGLAYAQDHTARRLELFLQRRLAVLGCTDQPRRRRRALGERGVWLTHRGDGTADLAARLASEDAERVYAAIRQCALADRNGDPSNDATQVREPFDLWMAGALVDLVLGGGLAAEPCTAAPVAVAGGGEQLGSPGPSRPRAETVVNVTIPIESLAGLSDAPGLINGFGVIPADAARRLAAGDARWRHVLTCGTSRAVLDVGTLSYRPPAALDRHVRLRDGTCRFPGCEVPAWECDLDHLVPFPLGPTSAENLHALCRRHHGLKHESDWTVEALAGHVLKWTSPQGATTFSHPNDTGVTPRRVA